MAKIGWPLAFVASAVGLLLSASAHPDEPVPVEAWRKALPATSLEVRQEPRLPGMVEIVTGDKIFYGDPTGRYLVFGHIYDLQEQVDITQRRLDQIATGRRIPWDSLPLDDAVRGPRATGGGLPKLAVLINAECGWCQKLYDDFRGPTLADVWFMVLAPEKPAGAGYGLAEAIVCSGRPAEALEQVMTAAFRERWRKDPAAALSDLPGRRPTCEGEQALAKVRDFARTRGLAGTPVLISADGRIHHGYLPPPKLMGWIDEDKEMK